MKMYKQVDQAPNKSVSHRLIKRFYRLLLVPIALFQPKQSLARVDLRHCFLYVELNSILKR